MEERVQELRFLIRIEDGQKNWTLNDIRIYVRQKAENQHGQAVAKLAEHAYFEAADHFARNEALEDAWLTLERLGDPLSYNAWHDAIGVLIARQQTLEHEKQRAEKQHWALELCKVSAKLSELSTLIPVLRGATPIE